MKKQRSCWIFQKEFMSSIRVYAFIDAIPVTRILFGAWEEGVWTNKKKEKKMLMWKVMVDRYRTNKQMAAVRGHTCEWCWFWPDQAFRTHFSFIICRGKDSVVTQNTSIFYTTTPMKKKTLFTKYFFSLEKPHRILEKPPFRILYTKLWSEFVVLKRKEVCRLKFRIFFLTIDFYLLFCEWPNKYCKGIDKHSP